MRVVRMTTSLVLLSLVPLGGCANSSLALKQQNQTLQQSQTTLAQRNQELQGRASTLDRDNQELETLLAQTRQQSQLLEDQLKAMRDQLAASTAQMTAMRSEKQLTQRQVEALTASVQRRTGAQITANSSLAQRLQSLSLPGVEVRVDGDVVRAELPAARLFQPGSASLQPIAGSLVDTVAFEFSRIFPEHMIGIEGHTDTDPVRTQQGFDNQQLSVARANAVYQHLVSRGTLPARRLFIVGHGGNQPVVSNATAAGKERNNRVEIVVYPDRVADAR